MDQTRILTSTQSPHAIGSGPTDKVGADELRMLEESLDRPLNNPTEIRS